MFAQDSITDNQTSQWALPTFDLNSIGGVAYLDARTRKRLKY